MLQCAMVFFDQTRFDGISKKLSEFSTQLASSEQVESVPSLESMRDNSNVGAIYPSG